MSPTANANLFLCKAEQQIYVPEVNDTIRYYDCAIEINPKGGYRFQRYDMPPFRVKIYGESWSRYVARGTYVEKLIELRYDYQVEQAEPFQVWENVFDTLDEVEWPWKDRDRCIEKIKKLIVFS